MIAKKQKKNFVLEDCYKYLIAIAMGFIPLIMKGYAYNSRLEICGWFAPDEELQVEFFSYYKSVAIIIMGVIMLTVLVYQFYKKKWGLKDLEKPMYLLMGYEFLLFLSCLFSDYKIYAFGETSYEVFENFWVVSGYIIMAFFSYYVVDGEETFKKLMAVVAIGAAVMIVIATLQGLGKDPVFYESVMDFLLPSEYKDQLSDIQDTSIGWVYGTLFNPDNYSYYAGILIPIFVGLTFADLKIWKKFIWAFITAGLLYNLICAQVSTGILALILTLMGGIGLLLLKNKWTRFAIIGLAVVGILGMGWFLNNHRVGKMIMEDINREENRNITFKLDAVETLDDQVVFVNATGEELHFDMDYDTYEVFVWDKDGNKIKTEVVADTQSTYDIVDSERFGDYRVSAAAFSMGTIGIQVRAFGFEWNFTKDERYGWLCYNPYGILTKISKVERSTLFPDGLFSGRGKIWNRLVPAMKRNIILGGGTCTLPFMSQYYDYIAKAYDIGLTLVDVRAHSWYIQQWVEEGLLALICLLVFFGWYFIDSIYVYIKCDMFETISIMGFSIFLSTVSFMLCNFALDSNVHTSVIPWCLVGMGMSINRIIKQSFKEITQE